MLPKLRLPGVIWIAACGEGEDFGPFAVTTPAQPLNTTTVTNNKMVGTTRHCHNRVTLRNGPNTCLRDFARRTLIEATVLQLRRKESDVRVRTKILLTLIISYALSSACLLGAGVGPLKLKELILGFNSG